MQSFTKRKLSAAKSLSRKGSRSKLTETNQERPIPFIIINKRASGKNNVKFIVTDEAKTFLSEITGPIAVVTVTGLYRTGKSYLINQMLLNRKDGFSVGGSVNACTKGIWIWSKPLKGYTSEGKPIQILIMDTQGLGSLDEDNNHDMRVFSLALLLSSTFIYNSVGNIDEGALQSLNLLVGLTKNIQVKAAQSNQNMFKRINSTENQQQFSQFFPNFLWVVRDFSLQLVDSNNDPISSKQYLESALLLQKGTSEAAEQKNRIRRALSQFFPDRDCVCMVRPLTDEGNLQSLEQLQLEDLRPQFVEQITQLRRKVLNRGKVKQMFGKPVHGAVLAGLSEAYVEAINQGAVPNIENAWTYVCQAQAMKAYKAATEYMNRQLESQGVMGSLPMDENQLSEILKNIKTQIIKIFKSISLEGQEFENKLINMFKKEKQRILEENRERSNKILKQFLQSAYSQKIERNLQNYQTFLQFQEDLRKFEKEVRKQLPKVAGKQQYIAQFMKNKSIESADFICRKISDQVEVQRRLSEESNLKMQKELEELRQDTGRQRALLRGKVSNLQNEKAQVIAREQCLRENLNTCIKEKQAYESKVNDELDNQQKENFRLQQEYNLKLQSSDENAKEQQRQIKRIESQFQNHQALLEQKITFLEKCRQEGIKKEKESADDLINTKRQHQLHVKELNNRFDKQLKSLQNKLDQSQQKINQLETALMKYEQKFEIQGQEWKTREQRILNDVSDLESDVKLLTDKNQKLHQQHAENMNKLTAEKEEIFQKYQKRIQDTEEQVKQLDEQHYQKSNSWQKDVAMKKQKIEFLQLQVKELTQQLNEQKRANQAVIKTIHEKELENAAGKEQADKKTFQIIQRHKLEVNQLKLEYDSMNERMNLQMKELSDKNGELELQMKLIETDSLRQATLLKDQLSESERQRIAATDKLKALDAQKVNLLEQNDRNHKQTLDSLQKVIQDKDKRSAKELQDASKRYETSIQQLRILHSQEKERLQARIQEQRSKNKRLSDQQADELEQRLAEERRARQDQIELLQMQSQQSLMESQNLINQLEQQLKLRQQKIQTLESYLKQTKDSLNKIQLMNNSSLQSQLEMFNKERRELVYKIEGLTRDIAEKEKTISEMDAKIKNATENGTLKEKELQIQLNDLKNQKGELILKVEAQRDRCKKAEDQLMQVKVQINKELALKAQEVQFLAGKLEQSKKEKDAVVNRYEEKIRQLREQYQLNKSAQIQHLQKTNKMLELRLQQKIKSSSEEEQSSRKRITQLQTQKDKIRGNLQNLEIQFLQQKNTYEKQLKVLRDRLDDPEDASIAINQHQREKAKLQKLISNLQRENEELKTSLSTKQRVLEKKQAYYHEERENGKKHQKTMQDQYLITIEKLQEKLKKEKKGHDSQKTTATLTKMEQRYRQKIRQMGDQQQKICKDLLSKNELLDQHIANLKISNQQQIQNKECIIGELERKLDEQSLDLQNLELQLNEWRGHSADLEYIHKLQVQLENQKVRAQNLQKQFQESENKRQQMMFNYAKQQAKSSLQKDQLIYMKNQLEQVNERLEQKKQDLLNQIDALRMNRVFSPNKSTRSFISPERRSGILTTSSSNSNLNLPLKSSSNNKNTAHKYSIQPSKYGQNFNMTSHQYLSPHNPQQQLLNFSSNNPMMMGQRTSSSRSPHVKALSMTQYNSPPKTMKRSPGQSKFATISDSVTAVGDNEQDASFVLPGYQEQTQSALLTNKLHQQYPKQMMHSHNHSHHHHNLHHHKVNSGSSSSANLKTSSSALTLRRSPSSITTAVNLNQN